MTPGVLAFDHRRLLSCIEFLFESAEPLANPYRFASGYFDQSSGLYKFGVRYYDPSLGRFTQMDPVFGDISDPLSLNRYQYANGSPVNFTDPSGMLVYDVIAGVPYLLFSEDETEQIAADAGAVAGILGGIAVLATNPVASAAAGAVAAIAGILAGLAYGLDRFGLCLGVAVVGGVASGFGYDC